MKVYEGGNAMSGETRKVQADLDGLESAARLLDDLRRDFGKIGDRSADIMGNLTTACGDDHFGHQFTDGDRGFKKKCVSAGEAVHTVSVSFDRYSEGIGGSRGASTALRGTDHTSSENFRRSV
ncbi:hypothetical protein [Nocardia sp. NPDC019395]|uniref:hypothetical protein n=1 Tax=Nocardia sp. NPDC019395 TaxID=3154686 RepID=UPI0033ECEE08